MGQTKPFTPRRLAPRTWLALGAVVLLTAGAGGVWWWKYRTPAVEPVKDGKGAAANRAQPVTVGSVQRRDMRVIHAAIGNITALNTTVVRSRVDGELRAIHFKEGQQVKAGQVLAEVDPRAFEVQLAQAQGQLARDQALFRNAQLDLERYKDLASRDSIARQQVDTQEALVRQLQGTMQIDQAAVDNARLLLSYTKVTAPISGRLGLKQADLGNVLRASDPAGIVTITQTRPISVVFAVPESLLPRINRQLRAGNPLVVEAWDREQRSRLALGRISATDNAIDQVTGSIRIKAEFANDDGRLFPNQFVNIRLQLDTLENALVVPVTAIQRGARGTFVYVVNEGTVSVRNVRPGSIDGEWISVEGDLKNGDKVVTDGADRLREGARVEAITPKPAARGPRGAGKGEKGRPSTSTSGEQSPAPKSGQPATRATPSARTAAPDQAASAKAASSGKAAPSDNAASSGKGAGRRPPILDRLPPEVQERYMKMSPEERRQFIEKMRERRAAGKAGAAEKGPASP
jgi:multidrug efflux system membrane fusion protein